MNTQTVLKPAASFNLLPVVENPSAIKVLSLSAKIFEQMEWLDGSAHFDMVPKWGEFEIIGAVQWALVVRIKGNGHLARVRGLAFNQYCMEKGGLTLDEAHAEFHKLPQIFTH